MEKLQRKLYSVCYTGKTAIVEELLRKNPGIDANQGLYGWTPLHIAAHNGHDAIVALLLAHPGINPNIKLAGGGDTPFHIACRVGSVQCVRLLARDPLVMATNEPNSLGHTPLWQVASSVNGKLEIIQWIIASGKAANHYPDARFDPANEARRSRRPQEMIDLLERFRERPERTRDEIMRQLGLHTEMAARIFVMVVFLCDGLLRTREDPGVTDADFTARQRFFAIAGRLPIELQMVLCLRAVGSLREMVPGKDCEAAFRDLAKNMGNS